MRFQRLSSFPSPIAKGRLRDPALQAGRMARYEASRRARLRPPAWSVLALAGGVEAQAGDDRVGVARVRVDGDPLAPAARSPALEAGRVERTAEQAGAVQRVADRARAVVARVDEGAVPAAVAVGLAGDRVGRGDRLLDLRRRPDGGHGGPAVGPDHGRPGGSRRRLELRAAVPAAGLAAHDALV